MPTVGPPHLPACHPLGCLLLVCVCVCVQPDDMERFLFFSRAALEFLVVTGRQPDVLHLHDWQSSAVVRPLAARSLPVSRRPLWQVAAGLCSNSRLRGSTAARIYMRMIATLALCA